MLNPAYANESGLTIAGYEDDVLISVTSEKAITFKWIIRCYKSSWYRSG